MGHASSADAKPTENTETPVVLHARAAQQTLEAGGAVQEAEERLQDCLRELEKRDQEADLTTSELLALSDALSLALAFGTPPPTAFRATALVAWLARHGQQQPKRWNTPLLDHLQLYGRLISSAWVENGFLAQQPMDNNRYLLLLGEIMSHVGEIQPEQRQHWTELASRCFGADFWRSGFFASHLQSLLKISAVATTTTLQHLAMTVLQACFDTEEFGGLMDRVLTFQGYWLREEGLTLQSTMTWAAAALSLLQSRGPRANAGCCLAAFFADQLPRESRAQRSLRVAFQPLLLLALQDTQPMSVLAKPCIYSTCLSLCGSQYEISCTLAETLCFHLMPYQLMSDHLELERLQRSATPRILVVRLCVAMGRSANTLSLEDQLDRFAGPLESWASAVSSHPTVRSPHVARRWFCSSVFFAVATVARESQPSKLPCETLVLLLKALSAVDGFREDSQEYRAICLSLVQCGVALGPAFENALLEVFCELHAAESSASYEHRLYFWLSVLAMANVKDLGPAWPAFFQCLRDGRLAARCVALAAQLQGPGPLRKVWRCALEAVEEVNGQDVMGALHRSSDHFLQQAEQAGGQAEVTSMLQEVKERCSRALQREDEKKALLFFQLLCVGLRTQPATMVQAMVGDLLPAQQPFRELFAAHVASSFPEATRQQLAGWLLRRFPSACRAFRDLGPAIGEPQPVLRSAL